MVSSASETTAEAQPTTTGPAQDLFEVNDEDLIADDGEDTDSAYSESTYSDTTSLNSKHYRGYFENGRIYQATSSTNYYQPTDEKQWEAGTAGHLLMLILDSQRSNTLFRAPVSPKWQNIIDLGTGNGDWALDVADRYPDITVRGVDLYPPPRSWTAPNCIFEVDNITQPWTWSTKFDFVHLRHLAGGLSHREWEELYRRIYDNLQPGGWIEQVDLAIDMYSVDGSLPQESVLNWGKMFREIAEASGRPFDVTERMENRIRATGFTNIQRQEYKVPIGTWPQLKVYKDAGRAAKAQQLQGIEGWTMYLLTKHGLPTPWQPEEVQVWLAKVREETNKGYRIYQKYTRVWAQKPFDGQPKAEQSEPKVENVASSPNTETKTEGKTVTEEEPRTVKGQSSQTQGLSKKQKVQTVAQ